MEEFPENKIAGDQTGDEQSGKNGVNPDGQFAFFSREGGGHEADVF